jgi:hypothetical protein
MAFLWPGTRLPARVICTGPLRRFTLISLAHAASPVPKGGHCIVLVAIEVFAEKHNGFLKGISP